MRLFLLVIIFIVSCSTKKPSDQIIGTWYYSHAEKLGDDVKNDEQARADFDKSQAGQKLTFTKDSTWRNFTRIGNEEMTIRQGKYFINTAGTSLKISEDETVKVELSGNALKIYSPENAIFVWRKIP